MSNPPNIKFDQVNTDSSNQSPRKSEDHDIPDQLREQISSICESVRKLDSNTEYVDITQYLTMPQSEASTHLGISITTLRKRWKEAAPTRDWPYRAICKIDKKVDLILQEIPPNGTLPKEQRDEIAVLLRNRKEELKPVKIRK